MLHGGLPDDQQLAGRRGDSSAPTTPVRVLITGDVASEGVNLHKQCHHLVHVDIPWSLIRIEQRNGRIDRYGQLEPPRIVALALTTSDERFSGDVRVLTRLLAKEHAAHTALGDAASLLKLHDVEGEEDAVRRALAVGCLARRRRARSAAARRARLGRRLRGALRRARARTSRRHPPVADRQGLFDGEVDFLRECLNEAFPNPSAGPQSGGVGWTEHPAEDLVELVPPDDLHGAACGSCRRATSRSGACGTSCCWPSRPRPARSRCAGRTQGSAPGDQSTQWPAGALPLARCTRCSTGPSTGR